MEKQHTNSKLKDRQFKPFFTYSGLALQMVVSLGIVAWLGHKIDVALEFRFPCFLLSFVLIVFIGMIYKLYKMVNKL